MSQPAKEPALFKKSRIYLVLLICIGLSGFIVFRETQKANFSVDNISWTGWTFFCLFLGLIMMVGRDFFYMVRLKMLAPDKLTWRQTLNVILLWEFASALSPGVVGGTAVAMFILKREGINLGKSTAMVMLTAIFDNLFYLLLLPCLFIWLPLDNLFPAGNSWVISSGKWVFWIGYAAVAVFNLIMILSVFFYPVIICRIVLGIFKIPFLKKHSEKAIRFTNEITYASREVRKKNAFFWVKFFLATGGSWICRFLVLNFVLLAFLELGLLEHLILLARQLVMWMILIIPTTPGGAGLAEMLFTDFLADIAGTGTLILTMAFIWRGLSNYLYLIIGSILLPRWLVSTKKAQISRESASEPSK